MVILEDASAGSYLTTSISPPQSSLYQDTPCSISPKLNQVRTLIGLPWKSLELHRDKSWLIIQVEDLAGGNKTPAVIAAPARKSAENLTPSLRLARNYSESIRKGTMRRSMSLWLLSVLQSSAFLFTLGLSWFVYPILVSGHFVLSAWEQRLDTMGLLYVSWDAWFAIWDPSNIKQGTWNSAGMAGSQEKGGPSTPVGYRGMPRLGRNETISRCLTWLAITCQLAQGTRQRTRCSSLGRRGMLFWPAYFPVAIANQCPLW